MDPVLARLGVDLAVGGEGGLTHALLVVGLCVARFVPLFVLAPFFGGRLIAPPIRVGIAVAFAVLVFPAVHAQTPSLAALGPAAIFALFAKELLVGFVLGFLVSTPFWAAEAAGRLVDTARGANMAEVLVPQAGTQSSPLGDFAFQLAIVVFLGLDGHLLFLRALGGSFEALPLASFPSFQETSAVSSLAVASTSGLVLTALGLAAPALAALFLADLALGLLGRVAPQMPLHFVGMPGKAILGLLVFLLSLTALVTALRGELHGALVAVVRVIPLLH